MGDVTNLNQFDWPGWPIDANPFGKDFDATARRRMVQGSQVLMPLLRKHFDQMGTTVLEIGPFFNPLVTPEAFPSFEIFYWENDRYVVQYLQHKYQGKPAHIMFSDLNKADGPSLLRLKLENQQQFQALGRQQVLFDSAVVSHVFNYTDYRLLLIFLKIFLKKDGLLFINNVINYGLPVFFSDKRPTSNEEIEVTLTNTGYHIIESKLVPSPYPEHQKNARLLIVAKNI